MYVTLIGKTELRTLRELSSGMSISRLSEELDYSLSYTSELVKGLEKKGLVESRKEGRNRLVSPSESKTTELYRSITQEYSHVDWEELLSGKATEILYYLDEPMKASELADGSDNYRATVHRILNRFQERGIIKKEESRYQLNEPFLQLNEFAREYHHQIHRKTVSNHIQESDGYSILWENHDEFVVGTDGRLPIDGSPFYPTGPERFTEYDIELITTDDRYYFYSEKIDGIEPQDLVCHTLLVDDTVRYRTYCLLLIQKEDIGGKAIEAGEKYGMETLIVSLVEYLEGKEVDQNMPQRSEFESAAEAYGVKI